MSFFINSCFAATKVRYYACKPLKATKNYCILALKRKKTGICLAVSEKQLTFATAIVRLHQMLQ
jgi:hypothetical protein